MSGLFHLELYLYCLTFNDEMAIQGQLPKVFQPMIGVLDSGMCRHNWHFSLPDRCDCSTACRLCRLDPPGHHGLYLRPAPPLSHIHGRLACVLGQ